jgi:hypothetical protein
MGWIGRPEMSVRNYHTCCVMTQKREVLHSTISQNYIFWDWTRPEFLNCTGRWPSYWFSPPSRVLCTSNITGALLLTLDKALVITKDGCYLCGQWHGAVQISLPITGTCLCEFGRQNNTSPAAHGQEIYLYNASYIDVIK